MSFVFSTLVDKPEGVFPLGDSPRKDYSGYNRTITLNGTAAYHLPVVKGATRAPILDNDTTLSFSSPVFKRGNENNSFTLEAWFFPISTDGTYGEQQVLGHLAGMDGITVNGTVISFSTHYTTAPPAIVSYDVGTPQRVHAVGIHTANKNLLYVNKVLVAEVTLTAEQQEDTFINTDGNLYSGRTSTTQSIAVNGIAFYGYALTTEAVSRHFDAGTMLPTSEEVVTAHRGNIVRASIDFSDVFLDQWWRTEEDWQLAELFSVNIDDGSLVPQYDGDVSIDGFWLDNFVLSSANTTSIYGVVVFWEGEGAVVEVSLNGDDWEEVQSGQRVDTIPEGFDPTDQELQVRIHFPAGGIAGEQYIDSLNIIGVKSDTSLPIAGYTVTYNDATPMREHQPMEFNDDWGVRIDSGGSIVITPVDGPVVRTIELWLKRTDSTSPVLTPNGTVYYDGEPAGGLVPRGRWVLVHCVLSADTTEPITLTGPAQLGRVVLYPEALTASEVHSITSHYKGIFGLSTTDTDTIGVSEPTNSVEIYGYEWSIQSAG